MSAAADRQLENASPVPRESLRLRRFDFGLDQRLCLIDADRGAPIRAGRVIGAGERVAAARMVELDHRRAAVARMQLNAQVFRVLDHVGDADAERLRMAAPPLGVAAVEDRHVAAVAAGSIEEAPGRGVRLDRRHQFEKARADRQQRVDQAVFSDPGIAVADFEAQDRPNVGEDRLELASDQADLPQPQVIGHSGSMPYQSTREYRYTLPSLQEKFN